MTESQQVKEWQEEALLRGRDEGRDEGGAEVFLNILKERFGTIPADLEAKIRAKNLSTLSGLMGYALLSASLDEFRQHLKD